MARNTYKIIIDYKYKNTIREAIVTIVDNPPLPTFWFYFKNTPPEMFTKVNGIWFKGSKPLSSPGIERLDLWKALTEAIDRHLSTKFNLS